MNTTVPSTERALGGSTRLILLGTGGGPIIRKLRSQPASLMVINGRPFLIDAGAGTLRQLAFVGFAPRDIERLFLTHLHFDHTAEIPSLLAFNWIGLAKARLEIYGPPGTAHLIKTAVAHHDISAFLFSEYVPGIKRITDASMAHEIAARGPLIVYKDADVTVTAVENTHYATDLSKTTPFGTRRSYSYRFDTRQRSIVFTGDTGPSDAVMQLARGADILVSEVIDIEDTLKQIRVTNAPSANLEPNIRHQQLEHLSPEEVGKMASTAGVKMVVLSHIVLGNDDETDFSKYLIGVRRFFHGPLVIGKDLEEF